MAARRHERTRARAQALQVLYGCEVRGVDPSTLEDTQLCLADAEQLSSYGRYLLQGVEDHKEELDGFLASSSENWAVERMPIVDRSILRLAAFEMIYNDDVPISVTINEAVELARTFGGEDESPRFVNGILGRIAKELEKKELEGKEGADQAHAEAGETHGE